MKQLENLVVSRVMDITRRERTLAAHERHVVFGPIEEGAALRNGAREPKFGVKPKEQVVD